MFTYRKFFDVDAPDAGAATLAPVDIAAIMAKSGRLNNPDRPVEIPKINTTETRNEPAPATTPAPATANQAAPAAQATQEAPKPKTEPAPATPQTAAPANVPTWQEVLKSQQPDAILKELGLDGKVVDFSKKLAANPKMMAFYEHWEKSNGDVKPYLSALSTDFSKMAPEDVMKHQLQAEHPELDQKQLDTLFKIKVTSRYKLDEQLFSEEEVAEGRIELMADVKPIRAALATEQEKFLIPKPPEPAVAGPDPQEQQRQQNMEAYKSSITDSPYTKGVLASKVLKIGEGPDAYSLSVDPADTLDLLLDNQRSAKAMFIAEKMPDGSDRFIPDVEKQWFIGEALKDYKGLIKKMETHFRSLGSKAISDSIENASLPGSGAAAHAEVESTDPAKAMATRGRFVRGGSGS